MKHRQKDLPNLLHRPVELKADKRLLIKPKTLQQQKPKFDKLFETKQMGYLMAAYLVTYK